MKFLVLGKGGREHAIAKYLAKSESCEKVWVSPGNPGILFTSKTAILELESPEACLSFLQQEKMDSVVVGAEKYIEEGWVDYLIQHGVSVLGPTKELGNLEASKSFCKNILVEAKVPTAKFKLFTNLASLQAYCEKEIQKRPLVLKWDYLAEGKGVFVCQNSMELAGAYQGLEALEQKQKRFSVLVEDYLHGLEFSSFSLIDGDQSTFFGSACDYKRRFDEGRGPNTGGMGAFSPAQHLEEKEIEKLTLDYTKKILKVLKAKGLSYNGFFFFGIMLLDHKPYVLEINTRLGDPETQVLLPRLHSDLASLFAQVAKRAGKVMPVIQWKKQTAIHLVKVDANYPAPMKESKEIQYRPHESKLHIFYSGVKREGDFLKTNGGRVLGLTCLANNLAEARQYLYSNHHCISFETEAFRGDIGC